jgi:hypothetical protein
MKCFCAEWEYAFSSELSAVSRDIESLGHYIID